MTPSKLRPLGLRCEHRVDPLGIDERVPRLSWALESEGRDQRQSAYRVLVARSERDLESEGNLLWDSGRVESGRTVGVEYEGEALRSGSRCLWKVRVWDGEGDPSPYGGPAVFETGLLERSNWKGDWISLGKGPDEDFEPPTGDEYDDLANGLTPSPYLRKVFSLDGSVRKARLYATARGVYELYVNGTRVGKDVLAPGWTDYDRRVQYQVYDATALLVEGPNALGAVLGDGWFAGFVGFDPKHRGALYGPRPQLRVRGRHDREPRHRRLVEMFDRPDPVLRPPHGRVIRRP
jgi:alpha-L-rhamnosidase